MFWLLKIRTFVRENKFKLFTNCFIEHICWSRVTKNSLWIGFKKFALWCNSLQPSGFDKTTKTYRDLWSTKGSRRTRFMTVIFLINFPVWKLANSVITPTRQIQDCQVLCPLYHLASGTDSLVTVSAVVA